MDARLDRLETLRERKAELARVEFARAYRVFSAAFSHHEGLVRHRAEAVRRGDERTREDMAVLSSGAVTTAEIGAVHEAVERRQAAIVALDQDIARALAERERLRQIALDKQKLFMTARRAAEKLGLLADTLRREEFALQTRLLESRSDSVIKDAVTGRWMQLQADS